jgi:squalene-hopene/tetraprenyl-beta-curcumene cyclase
MRSVVALFSVLLTASPWVVGAAEGDAERVARIDAALTTAAKLLVGWQSPDGAWRSQTYGCFKDGPTLTPYVLSALFFLPQGGEPALTSFRKGVTFLTAMTGEDGKIEAGPHGLFFPVYTAAMASRVVVLEDRTPERLRSQAAWLACLRERQLDEALGWGASDPEYGGWGFSIRIPRKPAPGELRDNFVESNLAATVFGIAALSSAKVPKTDPVYAKALAFVKRCQNFAENPDQSDPQFDDGGFFFIPGDALQNKAGIAGKDKPGRTRFNSYGTMTADGLRALMRCGLPADHPRVTAARRWLERNFTVRTNPGRFTPDREVLREATYYYWCWAVAHAFLGLHVREIETANGRVEWGRALAEAVLKRQRPDGSWLNSFTDAKEDDPLVATPWAAAALAICRSSITSEMKTLSPRYASR